MQKTSTLLSPTRPKPLAPDLHRLALLRPLLRQVLLFFGSFFCAGGQLYGVLSPFSLAFTLGVAERDLLSVTLGGMLQALVFASGGKGLATVSVLGVVAVVRWLYPKGRGISFVMGCVGLPVFVFALQFAGVASINDGIVSLAEAFCAGALGWMWLQYPPAQSLIGALALFCVAVVALAGLSAPYYWVGMVVCVALGCALSYRGKKEEAFVGAIVVAVALSAANPIFIFGMGGLCMASLVATVFGAGEKGRTVAFYMLGCLLAACSAAYGSLGQMGAQPFAGFFFLASALVGVGVFVCIPRTVLCGEEGETKQMVQSLRPQLSTAATRLGTVAQSLSEIAQTVNDVYKVVPRKAENFNWVVESMQEVLCNNCTRRASCWGKEYSELMDGLFALKPILQETERVSVAQFSPGLSHCIHPAALASEMTRAYAVYRSKSEARVQSESLRAALTEQYGAVAGALESLSAQLGTVGVPEYYKTRRVAELFSSLGLPPIECEVTQEAVGRTRVAITLPRKGSFTVAELESLASEVAQICRRPIGLPQKLSCRGVTTLIFYEKAIYRPVFGVAFQAAQGDISGDAVQQFCRAYSAEMILCDGMGTGRPAAVDGNLAAELTARLLKAGFTAQTAARLVNIALALKSEEESCATLDLISVDLYTGKADLFKAGAAPGFVVQSGQARAVGGASLPVGILGEVQGESSSLRLQAGDLAVLVSDGMLFDGQTWILQQLTLSAAAGQTPQSIAKLLVKTALARAGEHTRPDDITAAVLRLEKA